jgi:hypothetical protein
MFGVLEPLHEMIERVRVVSHDTNVDLTADFLLSLSIYRELKRFESSPSSRASVTTWPSLGTTAGVIERREIPTS